MKRDEIYDHLAQVYLGKRKAVDVKKKKQFNAWLLINLIITAIIFASSFYGLSAFLTGHQTDFKQHIIYSLHRGTIQVPYNFKGDFPPVQKFEIDVSKVDASAYSQMQFSIRAREEGSPGIVKIVVRNEYNELAAYYVQGIDLKWKEVVVPLADFKKITNWSNLTEVSFVLESWNVDKPKGLIVVDNLCFSNPNLST